MGTRKKPIESNIYYCNSRYYVPKWCRWLNADHISCLNPQSIYELNLFAYCKNNPVMYVDENGNSFILAILIGAAIGAIAGVASQAVSDVCSNVAQHKLDFSSWEMSSWQTYAGAAIGGAIGGAFTPFLGPVSTAFITGFSQTFITMGLSNLTSDSKYSFGEMLCSSLLIGGVAGLTAGVLDNIKIPKINSGRGSLSAIAKQINTKLVKEQIKNVSIKTLGKMLALNLIYSAPFAVLNGFFTNGIVLKPKEL